jgi:hypothetical protein
MLVKGQQLCFLIGWTVGESCVEEEDLLGDKVHVLGEVGEALVHQPRLDKVDPGQRGLPIVHRQQGVYKFFLSKQ